MSPETRRRLNALFAVADRGDAERLLVEQCGNNLPFAESLDEFQLERVRFAALKLSKGELTGLREAVDLAKIDARDLLMAAGFGHDVRAHEAWFPDHRAVLLALLIAAVAPAAAFAQVSSIPSDPSLYAAPVRPSPVVLRWVSDAPRTGRVRRGVIGGLIGSVAGVAVCTAMSNAFFNEGSGFSTCTTKGNLAFGGGGFALGFTIGWLGSK